MNLADGGGDYQSIDPLSVQHIEVWRGGNALEYGLSTLGGAVNFVMPDGRTADPLRVRVDAGSFGQRRVHAMAAGAGDALDAVVSATYAQQDGWREQSATRSTRLLGNIGYRVSDTLTARLYLTHVNSDLELPGSISRAALAADRRQAAPNSPRLNAGNKYVLNRAAARLSWQPDTRSNVTLSAYVSDRDRFHPMTFGILDQQSTDYGVDLRGVFDLGDGGAMRRLVVGVASATYDGIEDRFTNPNGRPGVRTGTNDVAARLYNLYAEYTHGITADVSLQVGAQATRATRRLDNVLVPATSYSVTFDAFSPKAGIIWQASADDRIFANVSRSFEPAPFGEAPVRPLLPIPNAQRATTAEIGWRRRAGPVELEATAYRAWIDNELLALTDANGISIGTAGHLRHQLEIRRVALDRFGPQVLREAEPLSDLRRKFVPIWLFHRYAVDAAGKLVGGIDYRYAVAGDGGAPAAPVPAATQSAAIDALIGTLSPATLTVPEKLVMPLSSATTGRPDPQHTQEVLRTAASAAFDPLVAADVAAQVTLDSLLAPRRLARMVDLRACRWQRRGRRCVQRCKATCGRDPWHGPGIAACRHRSRVADNGRHRWTCAGTHRRFDHDR